MNRKSKYIKIVAVLLLIVVGLLGCAAQDMQTQNEQQETTQRQETVQQQEEQQEKNKEMISSQADETDTEDAEIATDSGISSVREGFATPEEAVLDYLAGLRDSDFYRMAATFGEGDGAKDIYYQYAVFCGIDQIPEVGHNNVVLLNEGAEVEKLLGELTQQVEAADFSNMEFMGFVPTEALIDAYNSEAYQKKLMLIAQNYGGSELENRIAAIQINDNQYILLFDLIKKDGSWFNFELGGIQADELLPVLLKAAGNQKSEEVQIVQKQLLSGIVWMSENDAEMVSQLLSGQPESLPEPRVSEKTDEQLRVEGEGFDTPQQAAANYLEGFKAHDMEQMISTFAVESYAEHYNMQAELEWMQSYIFTQEDVSLPPVNDFVKDMINYERKAQMIADILAQGNALYLLDEYYRNDSDVAQEYEPFDWEELTEKIDLDSIQILGYLPLESLSDSVATEYLTKTQSRNAEIYGADETENCVIVYEYDGDKYCLFMETVKYNGKWYNYKIGDQVSGVLGIYTEYAGAGPLEAVGDLETVENLIVPIE